MIKVCSDHSALVNLCHKELIKVPNPCLINMLERMSNFNYTVTNLPGSQIWVVDLLSRYPSKSQGTQSFPGPRSSVYVRAVTADRIRKKDTSLWKVAEKNEQCATMRR